jgi:septal ring factor EnvC (AmiA/AmiB activator)
MSHHSHKSVTVLAVALFGFTLFQLNQIFLDRDNLHKAQEQTVKNIAEADKVLAENQKVLDQLNGIAIGTQRLSEAGNANAKEIVAQLTKLGIKINPNYKEDQEKAEKAAAEKAAAEKAGGKPVDKTTPADAAKPTSPASAAPAGAAPAPAAPEAPKPAPSAAP